VQQLNILPKGRICLIAASEGNLLMMSENNCQEDNCACPYDLFHSVGLPQLFKNLFI
jgi:hypothetical protein